MRTITFILAFAFCCHGQKISGKASIAGKATFRAQSSTAHTRTPSVTTLSSETVSVTVTQPGQTTLYLSALPGVVLDASVSAGTGQTCTDNSAAIQSHLASNVRLVLDGAACIGATTAHVCLDLRGMTNVTIEGQGWTTGLYIKDGANCIGITNVYPLPLPNGTFYNAGGTWSAPPTKVADIALKNFRLNANRAGQTCSSGECLGAVIYNVSGVTVDNLYINDSPQMATAFDNVDHVTLINNTILQTGAGSDPFHINGPADTITISGNSLQSGDDCVALNAPEGYGGNISGVTITNNTMTGSGCSDFLRIYNNIGGGGNPSYAVSATVDGLTGTATCSVNPAILYFGEAVGYGGPNLSITATNIDVDGSGNCGLAQVSGSWSRMDISNATLRNAKPATPAVQFTFAGQVDTSTISNMTIQRNASGQSTAWPIQVGQYSSVTTLNLSNNVVTDSGGSYSNSPQWVDIESVTNPGTVTTLTFGTPLDAKIDALFSSGSAARVGTVVGPPVPGLQSNTQSLISYTAPSTAACQIQVSEDPTFATLSHDFDPAIFTGSDQDNRAGSTFGAGTTSRVVVAGKRMTELGADTVTYYSRAFQTNTTHYWRACSGWSVTGSFITTNIPLGNTRGELVQFDTAGNAIVPTFPDNRTATVIDPQTGILAKRVNLAADGEMSLYSGGRPPVCGTQYVGPWTHGTLCTFNANIPILFYVNTDTGEIRHLGRVSKYSSEIASGMSGGIMDPLDGKSWYPSELDPNGKRVVKKYTYSGTYTEVAATVNATLDDSVVTLDLLALLAAYDASFDPTKFNCGVVPGGTYLMASCNRWQQDTYGWMFAIRASDAVVMGGINVVNNPNSRWCSNHTLSIIPNTPLIQMIPHGLMGDGTSLGGGKYQTTSVGDITDTATTMTVSSQPTSSNTEEPYFQDWAIGDVLVFGYNGGVDVQESVTITGGSYPTFTISRNTTYSSEYSAHAWPSGSVLTAQCGHATTSFWPENWWSFLADPTGAGSGYIQEMYDSSHEDVNANGRIGDRHLGQIGAIASVINTPWTFNLSKAIKFAGVQISSDGERYTDYPSMTPALAPVGERSWFLSEPTFIMGGGSNIVQVAGQLYSYTPNTGGGDYLLFPKHHDSIVMSNRQMLTDISGPGSVIDGTSTHSYQFCIPLAANECVSGSTPGTYYFNAPGVAYLYCKGAYLNDVCMDNASYIGPTQYGWTANTVGIDPASTPPFYGAGYTRRLSGGFSSPKHLGEMFKPTLDGKYGFVQRNALDVIALKIPPTPTSDGVNRSTFIRAPLNLTSPGGSAVKAEVEFWYAEEDRTGGNRYCTSRREECVVVAATVTDATPFWYKNTEYGSYSPADCSTGTCTITLPVLPGRVAYYQVKWYDSGGSFVSNGVAGVALESTVKP